MRKQRYDVLPTGSDGSDALVTPTLPWGRLFVIFVGSMFVCTCVGAMVGVWIRNAVSTDSFDENWMIGLLQISRSDSSTASSSPSNTATQTPSNTPTSSVTISWSPTPSRSPTSTRSPSHTPSHSLSGSRTASPSTSSSPTPLVSPVGVHFDWNTLPDDHTCPNFKFFYNHLRNRILARWPDGSLTRELMYETHKRTMMTGEMSSGTGFIQNGNFYAMVSRYYIWRPTSFLNLIGHAFVKYPHLAMMLPPLEFIWDQTDAPVRTMGPDKLAPILGYTQRTGDETTSVAVPDYSYDMSETITTRESSMRAWDAAYETLQVNSAAVPYENRIKKAIFRGAGNRYRFGMTDYLIRKYNFTGINDWLDYDMIALGGFWQFKIPSVPTSNYSNYAIQLYIDGNGASARFKYLLLSGSPVIKFIPPEPEMRFEMFYFPFLEAGVHYLAITKYEELEGAVKYLLDNPDKAKKMAQDAAEAILKYLHPDSYPCYYLATFAALAPKLAYTPRKHVGLFPVAFPLNSTLIVKHTFGRIHDLANYNMSRYERTPHETFFNAWFD